MRSYLCAFLFLVLPIISICDVCFFGRTHLWFPEICETLITQHDIFLDTGGADKRFDTGGADKWTDRKIRYILQRWEGPPDNKYVSQNTNTNTEHNEMQHWGGRSATVLTSIKYVSQHQVHCTLNLGGSRQVHIKSWGVSVEILLADNKKSRGVSVEILLTENKRKLK